MKTLITITLFFFTITNLNAQWNAAFPTTDSTTLVGNALWQTLVADQYGYLISGRGFKGVKPYRLILKSTDLVHWNYADTAYSSELYSLVRFDTTNVIGVNSYQILKSYQNGSNFITKDSLPKNGSAGGYISLLRINNTTALLSTSNFLLKTTDKGETWQKILTTDRLTRLYIQGNLIYSIRDLGGTYTIAKSTDEGNTWQYSPTLTIPSSNIHFQNRDTVYLYTPGNLKPIYRSYDGGNTFNLKDTLRFSAHGPKIVYFMNNDIGFIYNGNSILYKTCDGGISWSENATNIFLSNPDIFFFINDTIGVALARMNNTLGGYITWNQGGKCPPVGIENEEAKQSLNIKVYPNPTHRNFTIKNGNSKDMNFVLYDALGRILLSGNIEAQSEKDFKINLPPAIYFIKGDNGFYFKLLVTE